MTIYMQGEMQMTQTIRRRKGCERLGGNKSQFRQTTLIWFVSMLHAKGTVAHGLKRTVVEITE